MKDQKNLEPLYCRETWSGDSRDGSFVGGEGYHYFKMSPDGQIEEAYEYYETDDGQEVASKVPEMVGVHWLNDLGFEDFETLETIDENEFERIRELIPASKAKK